MSAMITGVEDRLVVATQTVKQRIKQWIRNLRGVTTDEIAVDFNLSQSSTYNIVHGVLRYRRVCGRWVPRSDDLNRALQMICQEHLDHYVHERECFSPPNWEGMSWWYSIMNQRTRDNRCSGSRRLQSTKDLRHRFLLGKSSWSYFIWLLQCYYISIKTEKKNYL